MAYLPVDNENIIEDINIRKEFHVLSKEHVYTPDDNILPYFMIRDKLINGRFLRLRSYQLFVRNFINPNTPYTRLMVKHDMGTGKTMSGIAISMKFISFFKNKLPLERQCFVYIIGFSRIQFERDLLRFPEFGFITRTEIVYMATLRKYALIGTDIEKNTYKDFQSKMRRRLGNCQGYGYFKFIGFRELANRVFVSNMDVTKMSDADISLSIKNGSLAIDMEYISKFKNCLLVCDEIHNVYNTTEKNNWGSAIQIILNHFGPEIRAVFLSGTILKNSPIEIVNVLNLISGTKDKTFVNGDFFTSAGELLPGSLESISKASTGRVSFLVDVNPTRYPSSSYEGTKLGQAKYLLFIRTEMSPLQYKTYLSIQDDKASLHENSYVFDMVFPSPTDKIGLYKSSQLKILQNASSEWKIKNGINVNINNNVIGSILQAKNIVKYSSKYPKMLEILTEARVDGRCKTFIYHKFVQMTGVNLIGEILSANGYLSLNASITDNTQCALCNNISGNHEKEKHNFTAARYIIINGSMNKRTITDQLEMFNNIENVNGDKIMIIVGSSIMREAYDLIAIRNEIIVSRPDNIPSLLQITARGIRSGSHQNLPGEKQNVKIYILTSSLPDGALSYEEDKYIKKINDYIVIQKIERSLHINALDNLVNRGIIEKSLVNDSVGNLYFEPGLKIKDNLRPEDLNYSTFNVYYKDNEVTDLIYVIKRHFMEHSPVWKEEDLWISVRSPPFNFEYDPSLFSRNSFNIAMNRLVWDGDKFQYNDLPNLLDVLHDDSDKRIVINGKINGIVHIGHYYISFPINCKTNSPEKYIDSIFRIKNDNKKFEININEYTKSSLSFNRYNSLKFTFMQTYKSKSISEMTDVLCVHGPDFHIMLIEEIISYIFDIWTDSSKLQSKEYNEFYFQMLYFYDTMGFIVWMNTVKDYIHETYEEFDNIILVNDDIINESTIIPKKYDLNNRRQLLGLIGSIERSNCSWCPNTISIRYNNSLEKSKQRFLEKQIKNIIITDDMVPVGHFMGDIPRFYHPNRGWYSTPEYSHSEKDWVENDIIIGFDIRSEGGMYIRFKLRNPKHKVKHQTDARLTERGIICSSNNKSYLLNLCKKLKIKNIDKMYNITTLCNEIRTIIIYNELYERAKGSNIKWYYNQFEEGALSI
jgi:hypothetical protein